MATYSRVGGVLPAHLPVFLVQELDILVSGSGLAGHFGDLGLPALLSSLFFSTMNLLEGNS